MRAGLLPRPTKSSLGVPGARVTRALYSAVTPRQRRRPYGLGKPLDQRGGRL